jgi:CubicO group peptidase (beta-lactamase class C family)
MYNLIRFRSIVAVGALCLALLGCPDVTDATEVHLPRAAAADVGLNEETLSQIEAVVQVALEERRMPGCVVAIGRQGKIAYLKAFGSRQLEPSTEPMTTDTVFDLASLTKPIATATSIMLLIEQQKLALHDPVSKYLPEFAENGKSEITIHQLLTHQSGLTPDNALTDYLDGPEKAIERVLLLKTSYDPGSKFVYSDVGFIVLGQLVERVSGMDLREFARQNLFEPLRMQETDFLPSQALRDRSATTEQRDGRWMRGEVHDPRSYQLGGVAGHAGLFSTADDLALYANMMLHGGRHGATRILADETVQLMTTPCGVGTAQRGLGWDMRSGYSSNRGRSFSERAYGHGGFTGTSIWMDPGLDLFVIFLSNRVHPDGLGAINPLAGRIGTIAADAIQP